MIHVKLIHDEQKIEIRYMSATGEPVGRNILPNEGLTNALFDLTVTLAENINTLKEELSRLQKTVDILEYGAYDDEDSLELWDAEPLDPQTSAQGAIVNPPP